MSMIWVENAEGKQMAVDSADLEQAKKYGWREIPKPETKEPPPKVKEAKA